QSVHGGTHGAACKEDVIDEHYILTFYNKGNAVLPGQNRFVAASEIIAVKGDVQIPQRNIAFGVFFQPFVNEFGEKDAARLHSDNYRIRKRVVILNELLAKPADGNVEEIRI